MVTISRLVGPRNTIAVIELFLNLAQHFVG